MKYYGYCKLLFHHMRIMWYIFKIGAIILLFSLIFYNIHIQYFIFFVILIYNYFYFRLFKNVYSRVCFKICKCKMYMHRNWSVANTVFNFVMELFSIKYLYLRWDTISINKTLPSKQLAPCWRHQLVSVFTTYQFA